MSLENENTLYCGKTTFTTTTQNNPNSWYKSCAVSFRRSQTGGRHILLPLLPYLFQMGTNRLRKPTQEGIATHKVPHHSVADVGQLVLGCCQSASTPTRDLAPVNAYSQCFRLGTPTGARALDLQYAPLLPGPKRKPGVVRKAFPGGLSLPLLLRL